MSDPREDVESGKYDLGVGSQQPVDGRVSRYDDYLDELMNYAPSFEGVEEGREEEAKDE